MPDWALPVLILKDNITDRRHCHGKIRNCEYARGWTAPFYMNTITNAADTTASQ